MGQTGGRYWQSVEGTKCLARTSAPDNCASIVGTLGGRSGVSTLFKNWI